MGGFPYSLRLWDSYAESYLIFDSGWRLLTVLRARSERFSPRIQLGCFGKEKTTRTDTSASAVCSLAFNGEDGVDVGCRFHAAFTTTKESSVVTDVHLFPLHDISTKERGPVKATTISSVGLPSLFEIFLLSSAAVLKVFIPAAVSSGPEPTNSGAEKMIMKLSSYIEQTRNNTFFTSCCLEAMSRASESRKRRGRKTICSFWNLSRSA